MARFQRGSLRVESRKNGETWVLRYYTTRHSDGKRVEHKVAVCLVRNFPTESSAWAEVDRQHLQSQINKPEFRGRVTFADLAHSYIENELGIEQDDNADPKADSTVNTNKRILRIRILPKWGKRAALSVEPLEIEQWLRALKREFKYENPTLDKTRRVMSLVYKHGQRYGLIPRTQESNPLKFVRCKTTSDYEAIIITPQQAFAVLMNLKNPERTLTLLAASTGLRISECLGLQWQDVSFAESCIYVRRKWTWGKVGEPKSKASKTPVPLHGMLADFFREWKAQTSYAKPEDWVFASTRKKGKQPRTANTMVEKYLRPAAAKAGVLSSTTDEHGKFIENDPRRFGFHNLRHSLASFLVRTKTDPKTVQTLLRHSDVKTTLQLYAHSVSEDRMAAQEQVLVAILQSPTNDGAMVN